MRFVFLDIETTGLDFYHHEIIEVAAIETDDQLNEIRLFERKIKPEHIHTAHAKALEVNGYTESEWVDAPGLKDVLTELAPWLEDVVLFAHNISFDWKFLQHNYARFGTVPKPAQQIDTMGIASQLIDEGKYHGSRSLSALCKHFDIVNERAHRALGDTRACLNFVKAVRALRQKESTWAAEEKV